jgi:hypothetical protein
MKKLIIVILILSCVSSTYSQIGKTYRQVQELYEKKNYPSLELRIEGPFLVEDKEINENEIHMIMYNFDSIVVGVAIGYTDSSITELDLKQLIIEELPKFNREKITKIDGKTYWLDIKNNFLILLNHSSSEELFPLTGVAFITDSRVIKNLTSGITDWKNE